MIQRQRSQGPEALPNSVQRILLSRVRIFVAGILIGVILTLSFAVVHLSCSESVIHVDHEERLSASKQEFMRPRIRKPKQQQQQHPRNQTLVLLKNRTESIVDFERQPGVVITTKIHGPDQIKQLVQCMCLLKVAYNNRPKYDVLVFHTMPLDQNDIDELTDAVSPANLILAQDEKTLLQQLQESDEEQTKSLLSRCNATSIHDLEWWTRCSEPNTRGVSPISYTWQAEFRSLHMWKSKYLQPYRYMLWFDSDAFPTKVWDADPVAFLIRNDLKILFDNFPQGSAAGGDLRDKIMQAYNNDTLCELKLVDGHFQSKGGHCIKPRIHNIHGFFHVTDLDFYRNDENSNWFRIMIGRNKFSRRWDDQLAITIPAAMRAPEKSWDMNSHNITLEVYHNSFYDGSVRWRGGGGFQKWWQMYSEERFPEGRAVCNDKIRNGG